MKYIFLFCYLFYFVTASAESKPEVYVLTSLIVKSPKEQRTVNMLLERINERANSSSLKNNFQLKIKHNVSPSELWNALQSTNAIAVLWLSHSKPEAILGKNIKDSSVIQNFEGYNVNDLFTKVSPSLKYLSIVGCKNSTIFDSFKLEGNYSDDLIIDTFTNKVDAFYGFNKAMNKLEKKLPSTIFKPSEVSQNYFDTITISNLTLLKGMDIKIKYAGKILGIYHIQYDSIIIPVNFDDYENVSNKNITIEVYGEIQIPELLITSNRYDWEVLKFHGKPIGFNRGLYIRH